MVISERAVFKATKLYGMQWYAWISWNESVLNSQLKSPEGKKWHYLGKKATTGEVPSTKMRRLYRLAMQSDRNRSNFEVETQQLATSTRRNKPRLVQEKKKVQTSRDQRTERKWTWNQFWFYHLWSWWLNVSKQFISFINFKACNNSKK